MKIYFARIKPHIINKEAFEKLNKYIGKKEMMYEIYSDEGILVLENKLVFKKSIIDDDVKNVKNYIEGKDILIDNSSVKLEETYQIPCNNKVISSIKISYLVNPRSHIKLNIILTPNENWKNEYLDKENFYKYGNVLDFYFDVMDHIDIYGDFCKNEINELLSQIV